MPLQRPKTVAPCIIRAVEPRKLIRSLSKGSRVSLIFR